MKRQSLDCLSYCLWLDGNTSEEVLDVEIDQSLADGPDSGLRAVGDRHFFE